ncbi:hypothetical protein [Vibrio sinaloensis]|uniref:hypothetical protein n=1 Tax=Photobacterium sp. (strain ATCC 43367) TaxID=379097 RepID=UPI0035E8246E
MDNFSLPTWQSLFCSNNLYHAHVAKKVKDLAELSSESDALSVLQCQLYATDFEFIDTQLLEILKTEVKGSLYRVILSNLHAIGLLPSNYTLVQPADPIKEYVQDRPVVVTGPSSTHDSCDDIDKDSVKVSLSCLPESKVDISYVSSQFYKANKKELEKRLNDGELAFVIVSGSPKSFVDSNNYGRKLFGISPFVLAKSSPMLGVNRAIYDLLARGIDDISIKNVDWYSAYPLHDKKYPTLLKTVEDYLKSLSLHDLATNFIVSKRLYFTNSLNASEYYDRLMKSTTRDYLDIVSSNFKKSQERM